MPGFVGEYAGDYFGDYFGEDVEGQGSQMGIKKGCVLPLGSAGQSDDTSTMTSSVIYKDGYYWMYYGGNDGTNYYICLAISKDGIHFTKKGVVIPLGSAGQSDDLHINSCSAVERDGYVWLYYTASDGTAAILRVCLAISRDGVHFTKKGVVLPLGGAGESDDYSHTTLNVFWRDGYCWMYYAGAEAADLWKICLATSRDGIHFTKKGVVIPLGSAGQSDDTRCYAPVVFCKDGKVWAYYGGYTGTNYYGCLAFSNDGIHFNIKKGVVLSLGANLDFDDTHIIPSCALVKDGYVWLYYGASAGSVTVFTQGLILLKTGVN